MFSGLKSLTPFLMITTFSCLQALSIEGGFVHVVDVEPGKTYKQQIILKNEKNEMVKVRIQPMDCQQNKIDIDFLPAGALPR
jgi:hypothetical protein